VVVRVQEVAVVAQDSIMIKVEILVVVEEVWDGLVQELSLPGVVMEL
jgi:hypothetical protein